MPFLKFCILIKLNQIKNEQKQYQNIIRNDKNKNKIKKRKKRKKRNKKLIKTLKTNQN